MKYTLFIGRWSPFHCGHKYIIDTYVKNNKPVCIAIRDSEEKYPLALRRKMVHSCYKKEIREGRVKIIIIPDIETVAVGRDVGYSIIEVPDNIRLISGTKIRQNLCYEIPFSVKRILEKNNEK
jgi:adenylylsulfate kinase